jgi:chromosome segregation ATPase
MTSNEELAAVAGILAELREWLDIKTKLGEIMAAQDDINAAVAALQAFLQDLAQKVQAIAAELAAGQAVDTSALNAVIGQLPQVQAAVDALAPPPAG